MGVRRLAGAPISWGVCEVPGWGRQLEPKRVFGEMTAVGLDATELGPVGYLPLDAAQLRDTLGQFHLHLVGGFVPLVLHEQTLNGARRRSEEMADLFAAAGADVFVAAILLGDLLSTPGALTGGEWGRMVPPPGEGGAMAREGRLRLALHPHVGTLIERHDAVQRLL